MTLTIQPAQRLRPNTVIIRKEADQVLVMLYTGDSALPYKTALNNQDLLAQATELVRDVGTGDWVCPLNLGALARFEEGE